MATQEEKIKAFREIVGNGDLAETILRAAEGTQKEAEMKGVRSKEASDEAETEKSGKGILLHRKIEEVYDGQQPPPDEPATAPVQTQKINAQGTANVAAKPKPVGPAPLKRPARLEEAPEEEYEEEEPEVDVEVVGDEGEELEEAPAEGEVPEEEMSEEELAAMEQADAEQGAEQGGEYEEMPEVVGNMSIDEFAGLLADALAAALEPYLRRLKEVSDTVDAVQSEVDAVQGNIIQRMKEARRDSEELTAVKARLEKTEKALLMAARKLKETAGRIAELESDVPSGARGYVASQATETVVKDEARLKEQQPSVDPIANFAANFVLGGRS